jgi:hypothetical protein
MSETVSKGKGRKGTRKAADVKIADTVEKNLDLKKAETLFDDCRTWPA